MRGRPSSQQAGAGDNGGASAAPPRSAASSSPRPQSAADAPATEEPVGAAIFEGRLQRALAIPPAERPPDVAAFVESAQLLREAAAALPLAADGRTPALQPDSPASQRQVLLAFLKVARAWYVAPGQPIGGCNEAAHVAAYASGAGFLAAAAAAAWAPLPQALPPLAQAVMLAARPGGLDFDEAPRAQQLASGAAALLAERAQRAALQRQLADLCHSDHDGAAPLLLTLRQLRHVAAAAAAAACLTQALACQAARRMAPQLAAATGDNPAAFALGAAAAAGEALAAASGFIQEACRLEPDSLRSLFLHAEVAQMDERTGLDCPRRWLALHRAAQRRGSAVWAAYGAAHARMLTVQDRAGQPGSGGARSRHAAELRRLDSAAGAAQAEATASLRAVRRCLPSGWLVAIDQAENSIARYQAGTFPSHLDFYSRMVDDTEGGSGEVCAGCKQLAIGLRRCARCKGIWYCGPECQRQHWPEHRQHCRPRT
ncbi:hypothetical protein ABPG75_007608 [Micractinium tetrahymenae]